MADIFLSYARKDAARALVIKDALEALGLSVFFDTDGLDGGDVFPEILEKEVRASGAVISVWNTWALSREWVRRECEIAREEKSLIPVEIGEISDSVMTIALSKIHRLSLHDFDGHANHPGWQQVVRALARTLKRPDLIKARKTQEKEEARNKTFAKKKRGLGWKGGLAVMTAVLIFGGGAAKFAIDWQAEQTRNRLIPPEVRASLAEFDIYAHNARALLAQMLSKVKIRDLIQAAPADPNAALLAGWAFDFGEGGLSEDPEEAVRLYRLSCDGGNMRGCTNLGVLYDEGLGVTQDYARAYTLYEQACDGGDAGGCTVLGALYANGQGVDRNWQRALTLFEKGCEGGEEIGCSNAEIARNRLAELEE